MFKKCLENRITRHEGDYKCYLCHHEMKQSRFDLVEEHLLTGKHKERLNQIDKEQRQKELNKLHQFPESQLRKIVENCVTLDKSFPLLQCHVCKCTINGLPNTLDHIKGVLHKAELNKFIEQYGIIAHKKSKNNPANKSVIDKFLNGQDSSLQSESNCITFDVKSNSHFCNICKTKIVATPNIKEHTQGLLHQALESKVKSTSPVSKLKLDLIVYDEKCNSYKCKICEVKIESNPNILEHIQGSLHQITLGIQKLSVTKTVDKIRRDKASDKIYSKSHFTEIRFCNVCSVFIENSKLLQCHVMLHLYEEFDCLNKYDLLQCQLKPNKKIYLKCLLCNYANTSCISEGSKNLENHCKSNMHQDRLILFKYVKNDLQVHDVSEQMCDVNLEKSIYWPNRNVSVYLQCNVCNVPVSLKNEKEHLSGKSHKKRLDIANNKTDVAKANGFDLEKDSNNYACFICNKSFFEFSKLLEHFKMPEHVWRITSLRKINKCPCTQIKNKKRIEVIECSLCEVVSHDFITAVNHMSGKRHNKKLKLLQNNPITHENINSKSLIQVTNQFEQSNSIPKKVPRKLAKNVCSSSNQNVSVIKTKFMQKVEKKFEASVEELNQLGFSTENILALPTLKPDMVDNVLENLVSLDFKESQKRKLPSLAKPKPPRAPKTESETNSFATLLQNSFTNNVLLNGKQYIKYCIDPGKQNIYNVDDEKISLLELGVNLTFPYNSNRVCLACREHFPDDVQSLFEHLQNQEHLKNIGDMQVDDKEFEEYPEQFSDLRLAKLYMQDISDQSIQCNACDIKISNEDKIIRQHAEESSHKDKSQLWKELAQKLFNQYLTIYKDIWYYSEVFFCEICKKKCEFEINFVMHLLHPEHKKKVYQNQIKGIVSKFDLCPSCITYWFGKTDSYDAHCKSKFHKRFAKNNDFMVPELTITASEFLGNVDKNIDILVNESDKVSLEKDKEIELLKAIVETVKPKYSNAEAYIFGSRLSHSGFPNSDVDVFLDCENVYYTSSTQEQSKKYIKSLKGFFENSSNTWIIDEVLLPTRVPIMKLRHIPTNLKCDISFINGLSVEKSQLVGLYNIASPICRKLILFMKKWLILCRIFGSDCITTFAISWCVIFYLQLQGILPTVHELIRRKNKSKIVNGWECGFVEMITAKSSNLCFKDYLNGFFNFYANFDYQKSVICPYLCKSIDKHKFAYANELPVEMDIYKNRLKNDQIEIFRFDSPLCVQDPIDLSQNMTKAVTKQQLRCFRQYCRLSAEKISI